MKLSGRAMMMKGIYFNNSMQQTLLKREVGNRTVHDMQPMFTYRGFLFLRIINLELAIFIVK